MTGPNSEQPAKTGQEAATEAGPLRILVVDDDQTNRLVLGAIVRRAGYDLLIAEDGEQAVARFLEERPDLVLMDIMMPVMDGYQATRRIKQASGDRFVPVIFLTALSDEQSLAQCVASGGDDFLTKPYNRVILTAKIDAMLRVRRLYADLKEKNDELSQHHDRLQREHEIAERVFANTLNAANLDAPNIKYLLQPMAVTNGDLLLAARKPSGDYSYLLGDFTGHGLSAAIGAVPVSDIFYAMTRKGFHISEIASEVNRKLKAILPTGLFLAACLIEYNSAHRNISVWNGGLPDLLLVDHGGIRQRAVSRHLPLGVLGEEGFERSLESFEIGPDHRIYAYSDGVIEACDGEGRLFGQARLEAALAGGGGFDAVRAALNEFRGNAAQTDDVTLLEVCCLHEREAQFDAASQGGARIAAADWHCVLELGASAVRNADPVPALVQALVDLQGLEEHRERVYVVLAELYSNALEYGLLRLDAGMKTSAEGFARYYAERERRLGELLDGWISIDVSHRPHDDGGRLTVRVEDSGDGFDHANQHADLSTNRGLSGRGMGLVGSLCSEVTYHGRGNCVEAVYQW